MMPSTVASQEKTIESPLDSRRSNQSILKKINPEYSLEPFNFSFFSVTGWGIVLDYCAIEWFALETNRDHSVVLSSSYTLLNITSKVMLKILQARFQQYVNYELAGVQARF